MAMTTSSSIKVKADFVSTVQYLEDDGTAPTSVSTGMEHSICFVSAPMVWNLKVVFAFPSAALDH